MSIQWTLTSGHSTAGTEDLCQGARLDAVSSLLLVPTLRVVPQLNIRRKSLGISLVGAE